MENTPEKKLKSLNLVLPPAPPPAGLYKPVRISEGYLYVSGQSPVRPDGTHICGRAGVDMDRDAAKAAARQVGLTMLSTIRTHFGPLDRIDFLVKTLGMVNGHPDFHDYPYVINGFSELMSEIFGPEKGIGARSAVGMYLPGNVAVEIEAIFKLH